jgi:hypothetical protein
LPNKYRPLFLLDLSETPLSINIRSKAYSLNIHKTI